MERESFFSVQEKAWIEDHLPQRSPLSYKFMNGYLTAFVGSKTYPGAARLSTHAAARVGAGGVQVLLPESLWPLVGSFQPEIIPVFLAEKNGHLDPGAAFHVSAEAGSRSKALLIGCGVGRSSFVSEFMISLLGATSLPLVIDGDGLYIVSQLEKGFMQSHSHGQWILTPHGGELERLLLSYGYISSSSKKEDYHLACQKMAQDLKVVIVAKAFPTVIYGPQGDIFQQAHQDEVLQGAVSTAGCGDVLAGAISGYLAQGLSPLDAARMGFYQTQKAAYSALKHRKYYSLMASDIIAELGKGGSLLKM